LDLRHASRATAVLALQAAGAGDLDSRTQRLSDEISGLAVVWSIPVLGLVLDFEQGGLPANLRPCRELWSVARCGHADLSLARSRATFLKKNARGRDLVTGCSHCLAADCGGVRPKDIEVWVRHIRCGNVVDLE
jgi:hypothetical protein